MRHRESYRTFLNKSAEAKFAIYFETYSTSFTDTPLPSGINSLRPELERALSPNAVQAKERQGEWGPGDDADVGGGENKGDKQRTRGDSLTPACVRAAAAPPPPNSVSIRHIVASSAGGAPS